MPSLQISPPIAFLKPEQNFILPVPVLRWDITGEPAVYFWYKKNNQGRWKAAIYDNPNTPHRFTDPTDSSDLGQRNGTGGKQWDIGRYEFLGYSDTQDPNNSVYDPNPPIVRAELVVLRGSATLLQDTSEPWGVSGTQIDALAQGFVQHTDPGDPPRRRQKTPMPFFVSIRCSPNTQVVP
jgi:hypothetical protein